MFENCQNKAMGFGVGTLVSSTQKNAQKDLEIIRNEMQIQGKKHSLGISTYHLEMKITSMF